MSLATSAVLFLVIASSRRCQCETAYLEGIPPSQCLTGCLKPLLSLHCWAGMIVCLQSGE